MYNSYLYTVISIVQCMQVQYVYLMTVLDVGLTFAKISASFGSFSYIAGTFRLA